MHILPKTTLLVPARGAEAASGSYYHCDSDAMTTSWSVPHVTGHTRGRASGVEGSVANPILQRSEHRARAIAEGSQCFRVSGTVVGGRRLLQAWKFGNYYAPLSPCSYASAALPRAI